MGILPAVVFAKMFRGVLGISEMRTIEGFGPVDSFTKYETVRWTGADALRLRYF